MSVTTYKERLRILLILYFFSEPVDDPADPKLARLFQSEVKIQKIDFLLRYPSYFCYELLSMYEETGTPSTYEVQSIIKNIFGDDEPTFKTDEMHRFFYGAYEELDGILSYLTSVNLVVCKSRKSANLLDIQKQYYITRYGVDRVEQGLTAVPAAQWYIHRCELILQFFGDLSGSKLRNRQYAIEEYKNTPLNSYIADIETKVRERYNTLFSESL